MAEYSGSLNLNSRRKPVQQFQDGQLKGGIKRDQLDDKFKLIFDALNKDGNEVLDAEEISDFWGKLCTFAKDDTLGGREAKRLIKDLGLKGLKKEDLYEFMSSLGIASEGIAESKVEHDEEGNKTVETQYTDGRQEVINEDGSSRVTTTDSEGTQTTRFLDGDKHLTQEHIKYDFGTQTTKYELNSNGQEIPTEMVTIENDENKVSVVSYEAGQPKEEIVVTRQNPVEYAVDKNGVPIVDDEALKLNAGDIRSEYDYLTGDDPILRKTTEQLDSENVRTTTYQYNLEKGIEVRQIEEPGKKTSQVYVQNNISEEVIIEGETKRTHRIYEDNRVAQEQEVNGNTTTVRVYDYEHNTYQVDVDDKDNGVQLKTVYSLDSNQKLEQLKIVNGKQYVLQFDGKGNIEGVVVQFGETAQQIAQKFGCTVDQLYAINGTNRRQGFKVGQKIKVPAGSLEPDAKVLQKRDSSEVAVAKYRQYQAKVAEQRRREEALRQAGMINTNRRGERLRVKNQFGQMCDSAASTVSGLWDKAAGFAKGAFSLFGGKPQKTTKASQQPKPAPAKAPQRKQQPQSSLGVLWDNLTTTDVTVQGEINGQHLITTDRKTGQIVYVNRNGKTSLNNEQAYNIVHLWNKTPEGYTGQTRDVKADNVNGNCRVVQWRTRTDGSRDTRVCMLDEATGDLLVMADQRDPGYNPNQVHALKGLHDNMWLHVSDNAQPNQTNAGVTPEGTSYTNSKIRYYSFDNCAFAMDENGHYVDAYSQIRVDGDAFAADLRRAGENKDAWYNRVVDSINPFGDSATMGTDTELQTQAFSRLNSRFVYEAANRSSHLSQYSNGDGTDALSNYYLAENSHGDLCRTWEPIIASGCMLPEEVGALGNKLIEYRLNGLTFQDDLIDIGTRIFQKREYRLAAEKLAGKSLTETIAADGWDSHECNRILASGYGQTYDQNIPEDFVVIQAALDDTLFTPKRSNFLTYYDKDIKAGLTLLSTQGTDGKFMQYAIDRAQVENDRRGYKICIYGQDGLQIYLGNISSNGSEVDTERLTGYDNILYSSNIPANVRAQIGMIGAKQRDFVSAFDLDSEQAEFVAEIIANDPNIRAMGIKSYQDLYNKAIQESPEDIRIRAGAVISGQVNFTDQEVVDISIAMMHEIDNLYGEGGSTNMSAEATNKANALKTRLNELLEARPDLLPLIKSRVEKEAFERTSSIYNPELRSSTIITHDSRYEYLDIISNVAYASNEAVFYDEKGNRITDRSQIDALQQRYLSEVQGYQNMLRQHRSDFVDILKGEGLLSDAANGLSRYTGWGTDRDDVTNIYRETERLLRNLELAAKGQLRIDGRVVSYNEYKSQLEKQAQQARSANGDYQTSIGTGKMLIKLAPVIIATTIVSGGSSTPLWATAATVGGTTFAMNSLEILTSENFDSHHAWEENVQETAIAAATTYAGGKSYQLIDKAFEPVKNTVLRTFGTGATAFASDAGMGIGVEYATTGQVSAEGAIFSTVFAGLGSYGAAAKARKGTTGVQSSVPENSPILFNQRLERSGVWRTANKRNHVQRLGGQKLSRYTQEFEDLCRHATTHEQLDQLQALANRFNGQAENTSFNTSITRRRAELNSQPAHLSEQIEPYEQVGTEYGEPRPVEQHTSSTSESEQIPVETANQHTRELSAEEYAAKRNDALDKGSDTFDYIRDDERTQTEMALYRMFENDPDVTKFLDSIGYGIDDLYVFFKRQMKTPKNTASDIKAILEEYFGYKPNKMVYTQEQLENIELVRTNRIERFRKASETSATPTSESAQEPTPTYEQSTVEFTSESVLEPAPKPVEQPVEPSQPKSQPVKTEYGDMRPGETRTYTENGNQVEVSMDVDGSLTKRTIDTEGNVVRVEMTDKNGVTTVIENPVVTPESTVKLQPESQEVAQHQAEEVHRGENESPSPNVDESSNVWRSDEPVEQLPKELEQNAFKWENEEQLKRSVAVAVENRSYYLSDQLIEMLEYRGLTSEIERLGEAGVVHSTNNRLRAIAGHEPVNKPSLFSRIFRKSSDGAEVPKPQKVSRKAQKAAKVAEAAEREAQRVAYEQYKDNFEYCANAGETQVATIAPEEIGIMYSPRGFESLVEGKGLPRNFDPRVDNVFGKLDPSIKYNKILRAYNAQEDITIISVPGDSMGSTPVKFAVKLRGKVSQADAEALIMHLNTEGYNVHNLGIQPNAREIQESVAKFFNNRGSHAVPENATPVLPDGEIQVVDIQPAIVGGGASASSVDGVLEAVDVTPVLDLKNARVGERLPACQPVEVAPDAKLMLAGSFELDLNSPAIRSKIGRMQDGDVLIIGRQPGENGISIPDAFSSVSRRHLQIEKRGDSFIVTDISKNGTVIGEPRTVQPFATEVKEPSVKIEPRVNRSELNKYTHNPNRRPEVLSESDKWWFEELGNYTTEEHMAFVNNRKDLFANVETMKGTVWAGYTPADQHHGAWKMHMYSTSERDWQNMCEALIPYLKEHGIEWKTVNIFYDVTRLNGGIQEGKAFTIYPRDNAHMEQVARDLDYIIRRNNLGIENSAIVGDRQMGETGRLFYRYEFNTGNAKDIVLDLSKPQDYQTYKNLYDSNSRRVRASQDGKGNYLASDMTAADDPWLNFNPGDPNSFGNFVRTNH